MSRSLSCSTLVLACLSLVACGRGPDDQVDRPGARGAVAQPLAAVADAHVAQPSSSCDSPGRDCAACNGKNDLPGLAETTRVAVDLGAAPTLGSRAAPVTLVIFSDFECPFCAKVQPRILALAERYRGQVRLVFKNQPLPMHERARLAAKAALAADEQGKFWDYQTEIFASRALDRAALEGAAQKLGLDLPKFRAAMDSDATEQRIVADVLEAHRLDVKGTPTFFVNGRRIVGAQPNEVFAAAIDEEIALARAPGAK